MSKLWISAGLKVHEGKSAQQAKQALLELQQATEKEAGCIFFHVLQHRDTPELFTLWEEWESEADLITHFELEHTKAYMAQSLTEVIYIEKLVKQA